MNGLINSPTQLVIYSADELILTNDYLENEVCQPRSCLLGADWHRYVVYSGFAGGHYPTDRFGTIHHGVECYYGRHSAV
jgi:hypothetical protein